MNEVAVCFPGDQRSADMPNWPPIPCHFKPWYWNNNKSRQLSAEMDWMRIVDDCGTIHQVAPQ